MPNWEKITPKLMRETVEVLAESDDCTSEMSNILHFMIGYYGIDYERRRNDI
jgi:hypothetical protein